MEREQQPGRDQRETDQSAQLTDEQRGCLLEQWQRLLEQREQAADDREAIADRRERRADEREQDADQRERALDERMAAAHQRDFSADQRHRDLDEQERLVDARAQEHNVPTATTQARVVAAIQRSREMVALAQARLHESEAALRRVQIKRDRDQERIDRQSAGAERTTKKIERKQVQARVWRETEQEPDR